MIDLKKLSKREKMIGAVVLGMLFILVIDRVFIRSIGDKFRKITEDTAAMETRLKRNLRLLKQKDKILEAAKGFPGLMEQKGTDEEEMADLLNEIETLARANSIYLVDIKPLPVEEMKFAKKFGVEINCESQMDQLVDFLHQIQGSKQLLKVEKANLNPKAEKSTVVKSNFVISKVVIQ